MWNRELTKKLIEKYRTYVELWDASSRDYKNKYKKENAVRDIAAQLGVSEKEVKIKIHNLRTQFLQEVRRSKQKQSCQGTDSSDYKTKWEFFDALQFIAHERGNAGYDGGLLKVKEEENPWKDSVLEEDDFIEPELEITHVLPSTSQNPSNSGSSSKRKSNLTQLSEDEAVLSKVLRLIDKPTDDYQVFGDYIATEFRLLKSGKNRLLLRQKIQRAILEVSEIDARGKCLEWE